MHFIAESQEQIHKPKPETQRRELFACTKCQKREFQLTQLSEMRLLAECVACGTSFIVDSVSEKKSRVEATDPNQHLVWNWKNEQWLPAKRV